MAVILDVATLEGHLVEIAHLASAIRNDSTLASGASIADALDAIINLIGTNMGSNLRVSQEQNVTVDTSEDELKGGSSRSSTRVLVTVENQSSSVTVRVGLTGVTSSTGELILPGEKRDFPIGDQGLFGITAASSATVHVKEWVPDT